MRRAVVFVLSGLALLAVEAGNLRADRASDAAQRETNLPELPRQAGPAAGGSITTGRPGLGQQTRQLATASVNDAALIQKYCGTCHNDRAKTGGLSLQNLTLADTAATHAAMWEKVALKLRGGMMP